MEINLEGDFDSEILRRYKLATSVKIQLKDSEHIRVDWVSNSSGLLVPANPKCVFLVFRNGVAPSRNNFVK